MVFDGGFISSEKFRGPACTALKRGLFRSVERSVERDTICSMNSLSKIRGKIRLSDLLEERFICLF